MTRIKNSVHAKKKRREVLRKAKGYYGSRSRRYRVAKEQLLHSGQYAYRDRRDRKAQFRRLWITRIGAAARQNGLSYSRFVHGLQQAGIEVKEIKFRPKIDPHDYATKKGHVERFLRAGARVKVTIMFRGREMARTELGRKILDRLVADLADSAVVEAAPKQDGRNMVMVIAPTKKPQEKAKPVQPAAESVAVDAAPQEVDAAPQEADAAPQEA